MIVKLFKKWGGSNFGGVIYQATKRGHGKLFRCAKNGKLKAAKT